MLEGRIFTIYTDHKPITYAFAQKAEKCSPRQFRYLDYIGQFSTDIQHIKGKENIVADTLSRIEEITTGIDFTMIGAEQAKDEELKNLISRGNSSLTLKKIHFPEYNAYIYCDISTDGARPFVTTRLRKQVFKSLHQLSHPGAKATAKMVAERFVWPGIRADCRRWSKQCLACQQAKVTRHNAPINGTFRLPSSKFDHVHMDIVGPLPESQGKKYIVTFINRFTRWPEAIPVPNIEASTVADVFITNWIARYGSPLRVTTD